MTNNPAPGFRKHPGHVVTLAEGGTALAASLDGVEIARTDRAITLTETGYPPRFYIPIEDVAEGVLTPTGHSTYCPFKGRARYWTVEAGGRRADNAAWAYDAPYDEVARLKGRVAFTDDHVELRRV
jgi:uncharacterized protein (DUF427 family)